MELSLGLLRLYLSKNNLSNLFSVMYRFLLAIFSTLRFVAWKTLSWWNNVVGLDETFISFIFVKLHCNL